ncbi:hypothetical protein [Deminuibacter soli]|uniref:Uncharacterized protein n=1 Tax=Deminuibacter soli TaxID=2291815 RepID=A0A3E1NJT1_9BACT|nr:hypothetical protein [Deminuibacter soli]RFM28141.1 hypothetical protein DXN05_11475 [Deminuibacter soli]
MQRYELHITRRNNWYDDDSEKSITLDEWKTFIKENEDMHLDSTFEAKMQNGESFSFESLELTRWSGYSGSRTCGNHAWFNYWSGNITVKNPDDEIIYQMLNIARKLNAKVQGTQGEEYTETYFTRAQIRFFDANKPYRRWWHLW